MTAFPMMVAASAASLPVSTSTAWTFPGSASESGTDWSNETNIGADDDTAATTGQIGTFANTAYLYASNFDFSLPSGATIDGIECEIKARHDRGTGSAWIDNLYLRWNSTNQGNDQGTNDDEIGNLAEGYNTNAYGGSADTWGASVTKADVERSDFGVAVSFQNGGGLTRAMLVDYIRLKIHYTA